MYAFFGQLFDPYTFAFLITGAAVANQWRRRREKERRPLFLTVSFVSLTLLSTPWVAHLAYGTLAFQHPPLDSRPGDAEAIVVLGGGVLGVDENHPRAVLSPDTLFRCLSALELYRDGPPCPIVVCGGVVETDDEAPPVAERMRGALILAGVTAEDIIVEDPLHNAVTSRWALSRSRLFVVSGRGCLSFFPCPPTT